jgi:hypothetical protein
VTSRPTPFDLVFAELAEARFGPLEEAIVQAGHDPRDLDGFLLVREAVELLDQLRPEEPLGEGVNEFVALVHAALVFWLDGRSVVELDRHTLERLLREPASAAASSGPSRSYYLQLPLQRVWGAPLPEAAPEPLDGAFVLPSSDQLSLVGVFGLQPGRPGFTVARAEGSRPRSLRRDDASPLFSPRLEGGTTAGLFSIAGAEELLELGYRAHGLLGANGAEPGLQRVSLA